MEDWLKKGAEEAEKQAKAAHEKQLQEKKEQQTRKVAEETARRQAQMEQAREPYRPLRNFLASFQVPQLLKDVQQEWQGGMNWEKYLDTKEHMAMAYVTGYFYQWKNSTYSKEEYTYDKDIDGGGYEERIGIHTVVHNEYGIAIDAILIGGVQQKNTNQYKLYFFSGESVIGDTYKSDDFYKRAPFVQADFIKRAQKIVSDQYPSRYQDLSDMFFPQQILGGQDTPLEVQEHEVLSTLKNLLIENYVERRKWNRLPRRQQQIGLLDLSASPDSYPSSLFGIRHFPINTLPISLQIINQRN